MQVKTKLLLLYVAAAFGLANVAQAQEAGTYARGYTGFTFAGDINGGDEFTFMGTPSNNQFRGIDVDSDISVGAAIGYAFENNFRVELEISRRSADIDGIAGDSPNINPMIPANNQGQRAESNFDSTVFSVNAFYDYPLSEKFDLIVGGGVGVGQHDVGPFTLRTPGQLGIFAAPRNTYSETVWNVGLGFAYKLNDRTSIDVMYRYFDLGEASSAPEINNEMVNLGAGPVNIENGRDFWDADQSEISIGLRFAL